MSLTHLACQSAMLNVSPSRGVGVVHEELAHRRRRDSSRGRRRRGSAPAGIATDATRGTTGGRPSPEDLVWRTQIAAHETRCEVSCGSGVQNCRTVYNTKTPGWILVGSGAALAARAASYSSPLIEEPPRWR